MVVSHQDRYIGKSKNGKKKTEKMNIHNILLLNYSGVISGIIGLTNTRIKYFLNTVTLIDLKLKNGKQTKK